jgi:hypothetical protein
MISVYRPIQEPTVEAVQLTRDNVQEVIDFLGIYYKPFKLSLQTTQTVQAIFCRYIRIYVNDIMETTAWFGDYIYKKKSGRFYVLPEHMFLSMYEPVKDTEAK